VALRQGLPQRTCAAQIAWTFPLCSDKRARPGWISAAIAAGYAGTQFQARPEHEQRRNIRLQVLVRDNNVDQALKALKKKMQREGIFREMKLRGHYEKPSEKKARERAEAIRRARKLARKKMQREGLLPGKPNPVFGAAVGPGGRGPGGPGARPGGFGGGGGGGGGFSRGPR
jgi:small subunit ribosomal protein S21